MPLGTRTDWFARQIQDSNPAPGYRHPYYGPLCLIGCNGYGWTATVGGSNARILYFNNGEIYPQNTTYRAYGFQVRCLLE